MKTLNHPTAEDLIAYLENPEAQIFTDICIHLAYCNDCRNQVAKLSALEKTIKQDGATLFRDTGDKDLDLKKAQEQDQIESCIDGQLQGDENNKIERLIERDPLALKSALHYANHSSAMKRELGKKYNDGQTQVSNTGLVNNRPGTAITWWQTIKHWLNLPAWVAVPATALATAILVMNFAPVFLSPGNVMVASYQDNPVIQFADKDKPPGIGFFTNAFNTVKSFGKMTVSIVDAESFKFNWPAVEKASSYTLRLAMIENGKKVVVAEKNTRDTSLTISGIDTRAEHRYEWVLMGTTTDAKTFQTTGGFVTNHHVR